MIDDTNTNSADVDLVDGRYLHVDKFAERTGKAPSTLKKMLNRGTIVGKKDGHDWFVDWIAYGERLRNMPDNGKVA